MPMRERTWLFVSLAIAHGGCHMLDPRVSDVTVDAPAPLPDAAADAFAPAFLLPAGSVVPSITERPELVSQIRIFDGLNDSTLAAAGGVVMLSSGKAAAAPVKFWSFGTVPVIDGVISAALLYVLVDDNAGVLTPRTDHPWLLDSIPGDMRYSAIRRVVYVPVTASYAGERITSVDALREAIDLGLVGEPVPAGVWRNMPVVPPGTLLDVGTSVAALDGTEMYARGYRVVAFPLGMPQPYRNNTIPMGQESRLLSGVATGMPPVLTTQLDAQPVFQYGIPAAPPTTAFNYTPVVTELDVRLASNVDPTTIDSDTALFKRAASNAAITGIYTDAVDSYVVTTVYSNKQLQFVDGAP
jgi:hypothetical protein